MTTSSRFWSKLNLAIATGLGFGLSPVAPGTVGAIWGLPLAWGVMRLPGLGWQLGVLLALYLVGVPVCTWAAQTLGKKDPGAVVWDEIATVPIVFLGVPASMLGRPEIWLLGFVLHRIFDISKLPPVNQAERLPQGWGIMSDDVVAGAYGCLAMHAILWLAPRVMG